MEQPIKGSQVPPSHPEQETGEEVKKDFKGLLGSVRKFLGELLDIRSNTDQEAAKEAIIADIPFKGHTAWILICSIFIASVGLNANSTAVVIGAMLISPLMGPILGIGMSIAINDIDTLRRSLKNFTVMVVLSVLTAYLFFELFPLRDESSELLARTAPDIRDVLIAFFGGLALVIARAKKGTIASVIFGVAIATALMPPLCTVGFGLAISNWEYAWGALYLFTINTIFIALATFLVLKLLRFPMVRYVNSRRRRLIARIASLVAIGVMVPAGYTFYQVFQESRFRSQAQEFISETIGVYHFPGNGRFMPNLSQILYTDEENSSIELVCMGDDVIPENVIQSWRARKDQYSKLGQTDLKIVQGGQDDSEQKFRYVNELYEAKKAELLNKDERIRLLEEELSQMQSFSSALLPFSDITAEARANYEDLAGLGFAYTLQTDFTKTDTIPVFEVRWKENVPPARQEENLKKMAGWLQVRLKNPKIQVREAGG
ncbi:DUF389 domain-containing protein [Robiginitalea sp. M366]|uniref:DUF389 domain-containing protein n=1 Tax=Robiginitalea aestuariiviva TaxID=3036903 RepID=UPI00240CE895|nr:DUF389 domain-containing protein [Robiginitalea aestuariiviva]MDG1572060.1 DUF389 domain-containing protein [Robiginitalea aestuariiviva]